MDFVGVKMAGKYKIDPVEKEILDAYHGTDDESAREILKGSQFVPSKAASTRLILRIASSANEYSR